MKKLFRLAFVPAVFFLASCASQSERPDDTTVFPPPPMLATLPEGSIDLLGLQRSLEMERAPQQLGYEEKSFNTCSVGFGYSSSHECKTQNFIVIHFQLQCRDTDGTVSTTDHVLTPVTSEEVKWSLGTQTGMTSTDGEGFGQIVWVAANSQKNQWLRLTIDGKFLALRAGTITRVVTPKSWCTK